MSANPPTMEVAAPKVFTTGAVAIVNAYGAVLIGPILGAVLLITIMKFSILTFLVPLIVIGLAVYLLPFGFGNAYVTGLVHSMARPPGEAASSFVVQVTLCPRLRTGLRAVLEDADDIGYLTFGEEELVFRGDSIRLSLPYDRIQRIPPGGSALRLPFIHGWRTRLTVAGLTGVEWCEFAERSSRVLSTSRKLSRELQRRLVAKTLAAAG